MAKVTFNEDKCKGCGLCISVCPKQILVFQEDHFNSKGFHPASIIDQEKCITCLSCAIICPDCVIKVEK